MPVLIFSRWFDVKQNCYSRTTSSGCLMNTNKLLFISLFSFFLIGSSILIANGGPLEKIDKKERCPVCGMFVGKYQPWITQLVLMDGQVFMFDGAKDMLAFYFEPHKYGAKTDAKVGEIWVKEYYNQEWLAGRQCLYVIGSDVYGPMGHEFIPFGSIAAADNFMKDHHGQKILRFTDITLQLVNSKRSGQTMKGHK